MYVAENATRFANYHVTVNSLIFGFIDDLYMKIDVLHEAEITIQSELRMGSDDFDKNYDHVKFVLDCLGEKYPSDPLDHFPKPCSQ